jgi:hypothetical protein
MGFGVSTRVAAAARSALLTPARRGGTRDGVRPHNVTRFSASCPPPSSRVRRDERQRTWRACSSAPDTDVDRAAAPGGVLRMAPLASREARWRFRSVQISSVTSRSRSPPTWGVFGVGARELLPVAEIFALRHHLSSFDSRANSRTSNRRSQAYRRYCQYRAQQRLELCESASVVSSCVPRTNRRVRHRRRARSSSASGAFRRG